MAQLSTAAASRIAAEAMAPTATFATSGSQISIEDLRIRGLTVADSGASNIAQDFSVILNSASVFVRARTLASSTLEIMQAVPSSAIGWGSNKITAKCLPGTGVTLFANGASIDVFWFEQGSGSRILTSRSVDSGSTWSASSAILTLTTFGGSTLNRITAPASNMLYFTQSPIVGVGTWLMAAKNVSGTWSASYSSLNPMSMGIDKPLATSACYSTVSTLDSIRLGSKDLLIFFAVQPLRRSDSGIFTVDSFPNSFQRWNSPEKLHATNNGAFTIGTSPSSQSTGTEIAFPRLQQVGSEYWITANERISFAGNEINHLVYFRSLDLVHWKDRQVLAGNDMSYTSAGSTVAFAPSDFLYGKIIVSGSFVYLISFDRVFFAQVTPLCGVTNYSKSVDVSDDTIGWTLNQPGMSQGGKGQAAIGNLHLYNPDLKYNNSSVIRKGSRITRKMGYVTANGQELATVSTEYIDKISQHVDGMGNNVLSIESRDAIRHLQIYKADQYHEYQSGIPIRLRAFNDTTFLTGLNGTFYAAGGTLNPGLLDNSGTTVDNMAVLSGTRCNSGVLQEKFSSFGAMTNAYVGVALQIQSSTQYLAVLFNRSASKFTLESAAAASQGSGSNVKYTNLQSSAACTLNATTPYWLHVQHRRNQITVFYSSDEITWKNVINFSGSEISNMNLPWGFIAKGFMTSTGWIPPPGFTVYNSADLNRSAEFADPNLGRAYEFCTRFRTGRSGFIQGFLATLKTQSPFNVQYVPDVQMGILLDNGTGTKPAVTTSASNIIATVTFQAVDVLNGGFLIKTLTTSASLQSNTYYWMWLKPTSNIATFNGGKQIYSKPIQIGYDSTVGSINPSLQIFSGVVDDWQTPDATFGGANCMFAMLIAMATNSNGFVINEYNFAPDIYPKTIEYVTRDIITKSGILSQTYSYDLLDSASNFSASLPGQSATFDSFYTGTWGLGGNGSQIGGFGGVGANAFMLENSSGSKFGDFTLSFDLQLTNTTSIAGLFFRAFGAASSVSGYYMSIQQNNNTVSLWRQVNGSASELFSFPFLSTNGIPTGACVSGLLVVDSGYFQLFIDGALYASFFDTSSSPYLDSNYIGIGVNGQVSGSTAALFSNIKIGELGNVKPYSVLERKQFGRDALDRVLGKDRIKYMAQPDGSLKISRFRTRVSAGSYSDYQLETTKIEDDQSWVSQIEPQGSLFAVRYDATLLDSDERRFSEEDYTDATSDFQAFVDAKDALRNRSEQTNQYHTVIRMNPSIEREDTLLISTTPDGTSASTFVVNDISFSFDPKRPSYKQSIGLRSYKP